MLGLRWISIGGRGLSGRCNDGLPPCWRCAPVLFETGPAEHRSSLRWAEGNRRLLSAHRALRPRLRTDTRTAAPFQLARFAALRIVVKLLVVKKKLLAGGEDKILPAIHTPEYLVLEFHDPVDCGLN